jgi:Contractile injection system tube protein/LysM domain
LSTVEQVAKAILRVEWDSQQAVEMIELQYNPTELSWDKSAQIAEIAIPGLDAPLQQFVRGQAEKLNLELFFDTTDHGMGNGAVSVTTLTDRVYQLIKIEPSRHAPPICTFIWNDQFPGSSLEGNAGGTSSPALGGSLGAAIDGAASAISGVVGAVSSAAAAMTGAASGNQRRNGFRCIVESVKQRFTLFSPEGIPLRATLNVALREYKTLDEQLAQLNLTSPDRTHSHVTQRGDTLSSIAAQYYRSAAEWRAIADANGIEDPRRLAVGAFLTVPPTP